MYLSASAAAALDARLMSPSFGFSLPQLVELAGLAVAVAMSAALPAASYPRVLVVCGAGNNGLDGLVAARWLATQHYRPEVVYPRPSRAEAALSESLQLQLAAFRVPVHAHMPAAADIRARFDCVVDALFGFSFVGPPRGELGEALAVMVSVQQPSNATAAAVSVAGAAVGSAGASGGLPILSIDIPSGWHVEHGDESGGAGLSPAVLVSLSAPKMCSQHFRGAHWLGGRFVPPALADEFGIGALMERYAGAELVTRLA